MSRFLEDFCGIIDKICLGFRLAWLALWVAIFKCSPRLLWRFLKIRRMRAKNYEEAIELVSNAYGPEAYYRRMYSRRIAEQLDQHLSDRLNPEHIPEVVGAPQVFMVPPEIQQQMHRF
jgi:hypothetical protein